jgi:hypothetical protein
VGVQQQINGDGKLGGMLWRAQSSCSGFLTIKLLISTPIPHLNNVLSWEDNQSGNNFLGLTSKAFAINKR